MTEQRVREVSLKEFPTRGVMSGEAVTESKGDESHAEDASPFSFDLSIRGHALEESIRQLFVEARESERFRNLPTDEQFNKLEHEVTELVRANEVSTIRD